MLYAILAAALFTGLLAIFWLIRVIMVALNQFNTGGSGGMLLIAATAIMGTISFALTRVALSMAGLTN